MNSAQREQIENDLNILKTLNLSMKLNEVHGKDAELNQAIFENLTLSDIVFNLESTISDFTIIIENDYWKWLPFDWHHPSIGHNSVANHLTHISAILTLNRPFQEFGQSIQWLKLYLLSHNCDNLNRERNTITNNQIDKRKKELEILSTQIDARNKENELLKSTLISQRNEIEAFYTQKQSELRAITDALSAVSGQKAEIDNVYKNVINSDNEIRTKFQNQEDLLNQIKLQKENNEKDFKALLELIQEEKNRLNSSLDESDKKLIFFEGLEDFIQEKQKEIIELGALAAGAALGGTFGLREAKIDTNTNKWLNYIPLATLVSILWLLLIFTKLRTDTGDIWIDTILNLSKTIPIFVILGFVLKQYSKERNLQEEYAFKAAIANTIKAYSDLLKEEDTEKNKSKQLMLLEAIRQVQNPPKIYSENGSRVFSFNTKGLAESIKNLNETITNLKQG